MDNQYMRCGDCGSENQSTYRFCVNCGAALRAVAAIEIPITAAPLTNKMCLGCQSINARTSVYCYHCGLALAEDLDAGTIALGNPAGFWIRLFAFLIDNLLVFAVQLVLSIIVLGQNASDSVNYLAGEDLSNLGLTIIILLIDIAYFTVAIGKWGQTIGKAIFGLKVTRTDGTEVSYLRSFVRYWAYLIPMAPLFLGFISIALSSHKRGWHDHICDTKVIKLRGHS